MLEYLHDISRLPSHSPATKDDCLHYYVNTRNDYPQLPATRKARDIIIQSYLKLVIHVSNKFSRLGIPLPDLISSGNLGLFTAIDKYDFTHGSNFTTYCHYWIKEKILEEFKNRSKTVRIPVWLQQYITRWKNTEESLRQRLHKQPTIEEVNNVLSFTPRILNKIIAADMTANVVGLGAEDSDISPNIPANDSPDLLEDMINKEEQEHIRAALSRLHVRDELILQQRADGISFREIGEELHLSKQRVEQIYQEALKKLKKQLNTVVKLSS